MAEHVTLHVRVIRQDRGKAFQVIIGHEIHWLPKSQILHADQYQAGDRDFPMTLTRWIANQKGLRP